jgi:hypothetical protein
VKAEPPTGYCKVGAGAHAANGLTAERRRIAPGTGDGVPLAHSNRWADRRRSDISQSSQYPLLFRSKSRLPSKTHTLAWR